MYERKYGEKYAEMGDRWLEASEIAKLMRRDIKAMIAAGELPGKAANYRVRCSNYSGGRSIEVRGINLEGMWQDCEGIVPGSEDGYSARACPNFWCKANNESPHAEAHKVLSVEGQRVDALLKKVHAAYNYDGSEMMSDYFDVNYYGSGEVQREW